MRKFKVSLLVMVVLGTLFGTGCNDMHQVFHEKSGGMVATVDPMVLRPTFTGTNEAELITSSGAFPNARIVFTNLNAIPATVRTFKVDYYDVSTGQKLTALTTSGQVFLRIEPVTVASSGAIAQTVQTAQTAQTGTTQATAGEGLVINPWSEAVKTTMYGNTATRADNKALEARVDLYCEDVNGNTFGLAAAFTLMP